MRGVQAAFQPPGSAAVFLQGEINFQVVNNRKFCCDIVNYSSCTRLNAEMLYFANLLL